MCVLAGASLSACQSQITLTEPSIEILEVDPIAATLADGDTLRIRVLSQAGNGAASAPILSNDVRWETSDSDVALVEGGLIRGVGPGDARITATSSSGAKASVRITVRGVRSLASADGLLPAFPEAEGWGATALNLSRELPLRVHFVTSRKGSGEGTLAEALSNTSEDKYDVIIFRVGGLFEPLQAEIPTKHVYVAGQTAPGDGVAIDGGGLGENISIRTNDGRADQVSDIVIRYLRILAPRTGIAIHAGDRIVLDHVSIGWSRRYPVLVSRRARSLSGPISGVVIQNSLFHSALAEHATSVSMNWAYNSGEPPPKIGMSDISVHANLFSNNDRRNPRTGADNSLIANNVIYNWNLGAADATRRGVHDFINNFGKHGPMSRADYVHTVSPRCDEDGVWFSIYASGNTGPGSSDPNGDNWEGKTRQVACYHSGGFGTMEAPPSFRRQPHAPQNWESAAFPVTMRTAKQAYEVVLASAGATKRLSCDGAWVEVRDAADAQAVADVRSGTGPSSAPLSAGAFPSYDAGTPCRDTDEDGLPDAWEERFFECATCADPSARGRYGYLIIEHYLNGTTP